MNNHKVTVVIRSKDEERWIGHAIQSVIEHIYEPEILIIDNDSRDSTKNIAKAFMADPDRENNGNHAVLRIIDIRDYSPGKALNLGVKEATGDYVLFLSSHCVLTKFNLEEHISDLDNYDALFGNQIPVWEGKKITKRYLWSHFGKERVPNMFSEMESRYFFHNALSFLKDQLFWNGLLMSFLWEKKIDIGQLISLIREDLLFTLPQWKQTTTIPIMVIPGRVSVKE